MEVDCASEDRGSSCTSNEEKREGGGRRMDGPDGDLLQAGRAANNGRGRLTRKGSMRVGGRGTEVLQLASPVP